ncbi:MAG: hypothetical protein K9H49_01490 [Bacteroidales bacterium]|nr:hypothetical protein [Bacteroidales bacterium]MCF8403872.1 hypothetical protein [Bacteroidales bacterium]
MKTHNLLYIIFLLFASNLLLQCKNGTKEENTQNDNLEQENEVREKPKLVYDDRGNIIERQAISYRKSDNSIRSKDSYYYDFDDSNNMIKEVKESYDLNGTLKYKNISYHSYDERNLKITTDFESYDTEGNLARNAHHEFKYNENGHKVEDLTFFPNGQLREKIILDPDETGALRSEEYLTYKEDGTLTDHKKYYYTPYGLDKTVDLLKEEEN